MPGILPMKVIKIGTNAQTRIAQACDRCRSKKIRCDGIRPCCTQCANVGFECKTSDKLSRRAFPRGYTESLEERVRALETEVRELKELLDEKDEKIDLLSRVHSQSSHPLHQPPRRTSNTSESSSKDATPVELENSDETFKVRQSPCIAGSDPYFAGTSSTRNFIDAFQRRLKELDDSHHVYTNELLPTGRRKSSDDTKSAVDWSVPPRLVSDQLVNIYFQEWAPLFPVVHRPTFLTSYQKYVANSDESIDKTSLAHLNLVFSIAALSKGTVVEELEVFESQWKAAIDTIMNDNRIETLQALVLAQIYCLAKGDLNQLLAYKGLSTTLSARLGLHQSQRPFELGPLKSETRKKLFWTLYTVDCFSSVALGLPKHIKDEDVHCELPQDVDDEYLSESGFQPVLPGEYTKLSSALALFKAASILSRVLDEVFPAKISYELSLKKLSDLSDELEAWEASLPSHLRLSFAQDKPSTGTITSRSPILSLAYHYIRALIQRPAITASLGHKASSVMMIHADSCKRMVQIIQLLDERGLSFSFCFNRDEVLVLASIGLLFHRLRLDPASKILKDNQRTLRTIIDLLSRTHSSVVHPLLTLIKIIVPSFEEECSQNERPDHLSKPNISRSTSGRMTPSDHSSGQTSTRKQLNAIASRLSRSNGVAPSLSTDDLTGNNAINLQPRASVDASHLSLSPVFSTHAESECSASPVSVRGHPRDSVTGMSRHSFDASKRSTMPLLNLDYLSFGNEPEQTSRSDNNASQPVKTEPKPTDWERLLGDLDNGTTNIFDASYGGAPIEALSDSPPYPVEAPTSLAVHDVRLPTNAELFASTRNDAMAMSGKTSPDITSSLFSSSSDEILPGTDRANSTDASTADSNTQEKDLVGALLLSDFEADLDFDFDLDPNWQEILTAGL